MSLICCGMFMFFTADNARVGAADKPALKIVKSSHLKKNHKTSIIFPKIRNAHTKKGGLERNW
jgi:hypothetical protein